FLRHGDAEPAAVGNGLGELERKRMGAVFLGPILIVEAVANGAHGVANLGAFRRIGERLHHDRPPLLRSECRGATLPCASANSKPDRSGPRSLRWPHGHHRNSSGIRAFPQSSETLT